MSKASESNFVYVTFIRTTPERLWSALTDADFMKEYSFGMHFRSEWKIGGRWELLFADGQIVDTGEVVELISHKLLVLTWRHEFPPELKAEGYARCVIELEPVPNAVKLTITHTMDRAESKVIQAVSGGWPRIVSNLKSLLETGQVVLTS